MPSSRPSCRAIREWVGCAELALIFVLVAATSGIAQIDRRGKYEASHFIPCPCYGDGNLLKAANIQQQCLARPQASGMVDANSTLGDISHAMGSWPHCPKASQFREQEDAPPGVTAAFRFLRHNGML